jgi:hypothetical protein
MDLFLAIVSSSGCGLEVEVSEIPDVIWSDRRLLDGQQSGNEIINTEQERMLLTLLIEY